MLGEEFSSLPSRPVYIMLNKFFPFILNKDGTKEYPKPKYNIGDLVSIGNAPTYYPDVPNIFKVRARKWQTRGWGEPGVWEYTLKTIYCRPRAKGWAEPWLRRYGAVQLII